MCVSLLPRPLLHPLPHPQALRTLLFGAARGPSFNSEWRRQAFAFCDLPRLEYGLVQLKVATPPFWAMPTALSGHAHFESISVACEWEVLTPPPSPLLPQGGPCGVLACVQAYVLKHLLFAQHSRDTAAQ